MWSVKRWGFLPRPPVSENTPSPLQFVAIHIGREHLPEAAAAVLVEWRT
jgi:hypothetical protein